MREKVSQPASSPVVPVPPSASSQPSKEITRKVFIRPIPLSDSGCRKRGMARKGTTTDNAAASRR